MRYLHFVMAALLAISYGIASAQTSGTASGTPTIVTMNDLKWVPGTGMMKGVDVAVLMGDPAKPGPYVVRLRMPANTKFPPHFHGDTENVTVISGNVWLGMGDKFDESNMKQFGPGDFASIPANVHHYAMTKGQPAIIQIHGAGPLSMTAVSSM
jgi:quercetin dioxygenase-like cupin family protein